MGGVKLPTAVKLLRGERHRSQLNFREPQLPPADLIQPPLGLTREAGEEWGRIAPILIKAGVITQGDEKILIHYCECWARLWESEQLVRKHGILAQNSRGEWKQTEAIRTHSRLAEDFRRAAVELGLTPASRARVVTAQVNEQYATLARERPARKLP